MQDQPTLFRYCECGCGQLTSIAKLTKRSLGHVKGQPVRFICGHATRRTPHAYEARDCGYETPCWVWIRYCDRNGYGKVGRDGSMMLAHVAMWVDRNGPVPVGLELDHLCRNPPCVNPAHLEPVTHAENMRRGKRAKLTAGQVREIRASADTPLALAERYGIARVTVYSILHRHKWKDID